jgi:hypothetical protein
MANGEWQMANDLQMSATYYRLSAIGYPLFAFLFLRIELTPHVPDALQRGDVCQRRDDPQRDQRQIEHQQWRKDEIPFGAGKQPNVTFKP